MSRTPSAPTRSLPVRPSLAQLKKQAKDLLKAFRAGEPAAADEIALFEQRPDHAQFSLVDAQRVLARAYGFSSWTKLRQHVEGIHAAAFCAAVEAGDVIDEASLIAWLTDLLTLGFGRNDAILLSHAYWAVEKGDREALESVNELALALSPSAELYLETSQQGRSFLDATLAAWPSPRLTRRSVSGSSAAPSARPWSDSPSWTCDRATSVGQASGRPPHATL